MGKCFFFSHSINRRRIFAFFFLKRKKKEREKEKGAIGEDKNLQLLG